jgi:hypothetical protein
MAWIARLTAMAVRIAATASGRRDRLETEIAQLLNLLDRPGTAIFRVMKRTGHGNTPPAWRIIDTRHAKERIRYQLHFHVARFLAIHARGGLTAGSLSG